MGKFYLHRDGVLHGTGVCADGFEQSQAYNGCQVGVGDPPPWLKYPERETPYQVARRMAYPPIGDQMDALWHAMHAGTLPKVEPWYSQIKAVKERHPKSVS